MKINEILDFVSELYIKKKHYRLYIDTACNSSTGTGKTIVEFRSAAICVKVCRYLNCRAIGD